MNELEQKAITALRILSTDAINKAKSGHPGICLGAAPILEVLFTKEIKISNKNEHWLNRDRFVMSAGHGAPLLYSIYHLAGFNVTLDDMKNLRQLNSCTSGHPEYNGLPGMDATTGPLGQGIAMAVGMAMAERFLNAKYSKPEQLLNICNHYTYVLCGDGDLQEGVAQEAVSFAGRQKLDKLIVFYDSNDIQLDGKVANANVENVKMKFEAMNWNYILVSDGNNADEIYTALKKAKLNKGKPTIIEVKTTIGFGSNLAGTEKCHGAPLGEEGSKVLRENLGWNHEPFDIPEEIYEYFRENIVTRGNRKYMTWQRKMRMYRALYPEVYDELINEIRDNYVPSLEMEFEEGYKESTRKTSGKILDKLSQEFPTLIGGSADLTKSTFAKGADGDNDAEHPLGRNINFGVREFAMAAIINGMTLHGGVRAFAGGFFVFSDYMKPAIRLAAMMGIPSIFVFTHDSIMVGEDGPTHQPIEQLEGLRAIPNCKVIRPADARETLAAWKIAVSSKNSPTVLVLTRQDVVVHETKESEVAKGGYIVSGDAKSMITLLASGSEVSLAYDVSKLLEKDHITCKVVSMPSINLFEDMPRYYRRGIVNDRINSYAIEMGTPYRWYKYAKRVYGISTFGKSGKAEDVRNDFGFTAEKLADRIKKDNDRYYSEE